MRITTYIDYGYDEDSFSTSYDRPEICPLCKYSIAPTELFHTTYEVNDNWYLSFLYLCPHCLKTFVVLYKCLKKTSQPMRSNDIQEFDTELIYIAPEHFTEKHFDPKLEAASPQFVKIYNQALAAETFKLDEIAGMGYRKALEFLIKDFAIHQKPEDAETIKKMSLGTCISDYIDDTRVKTLATGAAWIGNDETHYVRKQKDRDIGDMKKFIEVCVNLILFSFTVDDAASIVSAKSAQPEAK